MQYYLGVAKPPIALIPQDVIACALDANCMPRGRFVLEQIEGLSEAIESQELDIEIWIPEPVVWEWAEHLFDDVKRAREPYEAALARAEAAGLDPPSDATEDGLAELRTVIAGLEDALEEIPGVRLLPLSEYASIAVEALQDQILQTGAASRKPGRDGAGVKTGAADSASFRLIEQQAAGELDKVVLVSADKDATRHFGGEVRPHVVSGIWAAKRSILQLLTGSEAARDAVQQAIVEQLPELDSLATATLEGGSNAFSETYFDEMRYLMAEITALGIDAVESVGDIEVSKSDGYATALATVRLSLQIEAVSWDDFDDRLSHEWEPAYEVPGTAQVSLTYEADAWSVSVDHIVVD